MLEPLASNFGDVEPKAGVRISRYDFGTPSGKS